MHLNDWGSATRDTSLTQIIITESKNILKSCVSLEWWEFGFGELLVTVWIQIGFNLALFWFGIGSMHAPSLVTRLGSLGLWEVPHRSILSLMGQKTISWCLTSFLFLAYGTSKLMKAHVVVIFFPEIFHRGGQNYNLE